MVTSSAQPEVGPLLREWRMRRRLTQLELALDAGISTRHLSFVETGRSQPGRGLLLRVLERLELPFREQNRLLLAAGHAPAFPERALDDPELAPVREALGLILRSHDPLPAVVVDRGWNLVAANAAMRRLTAGIEVDPELLEPPINILRLGLHPRGMAPLMVNLAEWRAHFLKRIERQVPLTGDAGLAALCEEIRGYAAADGAPDPGPTRAVGEVLGPLKVRAPEGGVLSFFGMFATFDTPFDVTTSELAIELLFPVDQATTDLLSTESRRNEGSGEFQ